MNKARRKELDRITAGIDAAAASLGDLICDLESVREDEQDSFDNLPEGLQASEQGARMQERIELMDQGISALDTFIDEIAGIELATAAD